MNDSIAQSIEVFVSLLDFHIIYGCTNSKFSSDYGMIILLCYNKLQGNDAHKKCQQYQSHNYLHMSLYALCQFHMLISGRDV